MASKLLRPLSKRVVARSMPSLSKRLTSAAMALTGKASSAKRSGQSKLRSRLGALQGRGAASISSTSLTLDCP